LGSNFKKREQNQPQTSVWGSENELETPAHPSSPKKERTLHEPQNEILIKRKLTAKAGNYI